MQRLFAVVRSRGPAWDDSKPMEEQAGWDAHAAFMTALTAEGFVAAGGPLEDTRDVLLVVRAADPAEIRERLAADPWAPSGHLALKQVSPWRIRLGAMK